ncbi:hypothetical protein HC762_01275 [bacterium]|nr:hypothetical protein [bacterium]
MQRPLDRREVDAAGCLCVMLAQIVASVKSQHRRRMMTVCCLAAPAVSAEGSWFEPPNVLPSNLTLPVEKLEKIWSLARSETAAA